MTDRLLVSLGSGTLLGIMGESGVEVASGDSGGPMDMEISGGRVEVRDLERGMVGKGGRKLAVEEMRLKKGSWTLAVGG